MTEPLDPSSRDEGVPSTDPAGEPATAEEQAAGTDETKRDTAPPGPAGTQAPGTGADPAQAHAAGTGTRADTGTPEVDATATRAPETADAADARTAGPETAAEPGWRGALTGVWRERRTLVLAIAAVLVVAVAATLVVSTAGDDGDDVGDDRPVPSGTMPTLGSQFAVPAAGTPTSAPGTPAALPTHSGTPLWTVPLPADTDEFNLPGFAVSDHGYVLETGGQVIGLDKAGKKLWDFTPPEADSYDLRVTGPQVFVGYDNPDDDRWPQPQVIIALDAATGAELWRETEASLWSVTADTVHMSVCYGGQNDRVGDCTLSARDPATNTTRWQIPTYASSRVENDSRIIQAAPTPPFLLVGAYPTGADSYVLSAHDPATGATLGRGYKRPDGRVEAIDAMTERTVVTSGRPDDNPADGCTADLTGFTVSGAGEVWRYRARTPKENDGKRCTSQPLSVNEGRLGVTAENGAPSVLNLDTGAIEWSAPPAGHAVAASDTTLLTVESTEAGSTEAGAGELVAYRVGVATPLWRAPFKGRLDTSSVSITDRHVLVIDHGQDAVGYDVTTGKAWTYGGPAETETDTWFAVCAETACHGHAIA